MANTPKDILKMIEGKGDRVLTDGLMFDGSSIAGWKAINESDMILMPDLETPLHRPVLRADRRC
jgi:glutamine synthetase